MFWALWDRFLDGLASASALIIAFMILGVTTDVTMRFSGHGGIPWVFDYVEYGILAVTAFMAAYIMRLSRHVEVDLVLMVVPPAVAKAMRVFSGILLVLISSVLAFYALRATMQAYGQGSLIFRYILIPEWMPFAAISFMFFTLAVEGVRRAYLKSKEELPSGVSRTDAF
ncbi:MAG: TRAP transporter small permease [Alphaproteobacteria bacterium]|nr:TRAP transporter small permease [Alphaproteobacteria bacterium]